MQSFPIHPRLEGTRYKQAQERKKWQVLHHLPVSILTSSCRKYYRKGTWNSLASGHCGVAYHFGNLFIHWLHPLHKSRCLIVRGFLARLKNIITENRCFPLPHLSPLAENSSLSPCLSPMSHPILMPPPVDSSNIISFLKFYTSTPICKTRPPSNTQFCHTSSMTVMDGITFQHSPFFIHNQLLSGST